MSRIVFVMENNMFFLFLCAKSLGHVDRADTRLVPKTCATSLPRASRTSATVASAAFAVISGNNVQISEMLTPAKQRMEPNIFYNHTSVKYIVHLWQGIQQNKTNDKVFLTNLKN